jgi:hypothetical protein
MFGRSTAEVNALIALIVFAVAFVMHIGNLNNALLGWDAYATIIASRVETAADLWGTFSEVLMDGRLQVGEFYRPLGNLFIAIDHAIWGLDPFGYQLTNLAMWALSASLVFLLARRILGDSATLGPLVAVLFYILHPAMLSILPYAARRTETLQIVFILLTLISLPISEAERTRPRFWLAGLFAVLAVGSKETGIIVLPLAFAHQFLTLQCAKIHGRVVETVCAVAPAIILIAGFLAVRFAVIGGWGGYHQTAATSLIERFATFSLRYLETVTVTGAAATSSFADALFLAILLILITIIVWLVIASRSWTNDQRLRVVGLAAVGGIWLLGQVFLACLSFQFSARYLVGMVAGLALVLAALVQGIWITQSIPNARIRIPAALAAVSLAVMMTSGITGSKLWYGYPGIAEASRIQKNELIVLTDRMQTRPPQRPITLRVRRQVGIMDEAVDHAWMLSPWGLQAWLEMSFPDVPVQLGPNNNARISRSHWELVMFPEQKR